MRLRPRLIVIGHFFCPPNSCIPAVLIRSCDWHGPAVRVTGLQRCRLFIIRLSLFLERLSTVCSFLDRRDQSKETAETQVGATKEDPGVNGHRSMFKLCSKVTALGITCAPAELKFTGVDLEVVPCRELNAVQSAIVTIVQFTVAADVLDTDTQLRDWIPHEIGMHTVGLLGRCRSHERSWIVGFRKTVVQAGSPGR